MKKHPLAFCLGLLCLGFSLVVISCKKDATHPNPRTIRYILYTKQDFSNEQDTIRFRLHIHSSGVTGKVLLDSNIAPMTISAIPDSLHALVFDKNVPAGYEKEKLTIGFVYDIDNVGESWHLDSLSPGENHKTVVYEFR